MNGLLRTTYILIFIMSLSSFAFTADLSLSVYLSEDEIINAYISGDISYPQMVTLIEIKDAGLDSTNIHLLDDIPNLSFFIRENTSLKTQLQQDQKAPFTLNPPVKINKPDLTGSVLYRYYQYIEENPETKYTNSFHLKYNDNLFFDAKLRREYSGRERITYRTIKYVNDKGRIKRLTFGNFTKRFGLGTIFGHRGKLLNYSSELNDESILFPDYGGYNGLYSLVQNNNYQVQSLISLNRDNHNSLTSLGVMFSRISKRFQPGIILGINKIKNRDSKRTLNDIKFGLNYLYKYQGGYNSLEVSFQDSNKSMAAIVSEGRHRFNDAEIKYAGWIYNDNLIDLSSGSKSLYLPSQDTLENIDFTYTNKRAGQKGMLLKTTIDLNNKTRLSNSLLSGIKNHDSLDVQFSSILTRNISNKFFLSLNYLSKYKKRNRLTYKYDTKKRLTKIELRYRYGQIYWRNNIGYLTETDDKDYFSFFSNIRFIQKDFRIVEFCLNISKIDIKRQLLDYWYGFIRYENKLAKGIKTAVKLSHTYNRGSGNKHRTLISLELNMVL